MLFIATCRHTSAVTSWVGLDAIDPIYPPSLFHPKNLGPTRPELWARGGADLQVQKTLVGQDLLRARFLGPYMFRGERPNIGVSRTRLNTAKDEKMSSRSILCAEDGRKVGRAGWVAAHHIRADEM